MKRILQYTAALEGSEQYRYMLLTLTVPNVPVVLLNATLAWMSEAWNRCRQRKSYGKDYIVGWARATEITYNADRNNYHPHYHILLVVTPRASDRWESMLIDDWIQCYKGRGQASYLAQDIRPIYCADVLDDDPQAAAILETFKYTQKSHDLLSMPARQLYKYAYQIAGKRMIAFGGILKDAKAALNISDNDLDSVKDNPDIDACRYCGSQAVHDLICRWCGVSYDPMI